MLFYSRIYDNKQRSLNDISRHKVKGIIASVDAYCKNEGITHLEEYPLINEVKNYLRSCWFEAIDYKHISKLIDMFLSDLKKWNLQGSPSVELKLLPILINRMLSHFGDDYARPPNFRDIELDLEDLHFLEVQHDYSKVWRIPQTHRIPEIVMSSAPLNVEIAKAVTSHFLKKYASNQVDECEMIVRKDLANFHDDPFEMTACLILLAKNNLLEQKNLEIILSVSTRRKFMHENRCFFDLISLAKSLVILSRYHILSDVTRKMIAEYINFGVTNKDWKYLSVHTPDPQRLVFFFKLLVDLELWSLDNARLLLNNKKALMELMADEPKPLANLLNILKDRELLTIPRIKRST